MTAGYDQDDDGVVKAEGSMPTAEEVKNLQTFIEDEQKRSAKSSMSRKKMYMLAGSLCCLLVAIITMSVVIAQSKTSSGSARQQAIVNYLSDNFADRTSLETRESPQQRAARWMADQDKMNMGIPKSTEYEDAYKFVQRYALAVLYFAWSGEEKWTFDYQFLSDKDECDWNYQYKVGGSDDTFDLGVKCNDDNEVDYIFMPNNGLDGELPGELGLLLALSHLSLYNNNLKGELPIQMMYLTDLRFLALDQNAVTGTIPDWLPQLSHMKFLALGGNKLTGEIPTSLTELTKLSELSLENNRIRGDISVLNDIPTLTRIFLGNNELKGTIGHEFLNGLPDLKELDISSNEFEGTIPHHFLDYEILDIHDNAIEGGIPNIERDDHPIKYMLIHDNGITGKLHNTIARLESLTRLDVSNNDLTGTFPESLADMDQLQYLYLANNGWNSGTIPNSWQNLTGLVELSLKGTNRYGTVHHWIGREMTNLRLLSLDNNNLSGEIPDTLGNLEDLEYLLLNQNNLSGEIPEDLKHLQSLKMLRLDDNTLTGNADPICHHIPESLDIFTSDCGSDDFECKCCSNCCADPDSGCDDAKIPVNDINWQQFYPKDQHLFSEDLVMDDLGARL